MFHIVEAARAARSFVADRRGVTAMEYGLIAALIAVAIVGILQTVGQDLGTTFTKISTQLQSANK